MMPPSPRGASRYLPHLALALLIGIAEPHVELWWHCRAGFEHSEACVWGRSYLPLMRWLAPAIVAPIAFFVLVLGSWLTAEAVRRFRR
jgi:hypothetical protein